MVSLKRGWCSTARNHGWLWSQMQMRIECRWGQPHVQFKSAMSSRQARTRGTGHVKITYRRGLAAQMTDGRVTSGNGRYVVVVQRSPSPPNDVENFHQRIIDKRQAAAPYSMLGSNATYLHDAKARSSHCTLRWDLWHGFILLLPLLDLHENNLTAIPCPWSTNRYWAIERGINKCLSISIDIRVRPSTTSSQRK